MEAEPIDQINFDGVDKAVLERIQNGDPLKVEVLNLRSKAQALASLLTLDCDFILILNSVSPVFSMEKVFELLEEGNAIVTVLAFSFTA